jgi:hypothetical protein
MSVVLSSPPPSRVKLQNWSSRRIGLLLNLSARAACAFSTVTCDGERRSSTIVIFPAAGFVWLLRITF